jgi:hypothetical protein
VRREQSPGLDPETEGPPRWLSYLDDDGASEVIRMTYGPNFEGGRTQVHQVLLSGSIGIGRGCRFGRGSSNRRPEHSVRSGGPARPVPSATRLVEAAAALARGRRRSASAA